MRLAIFELAIAVGLMLASSAFAQDKPKVLIGFVGKSQSNPVFQVAEQGAKDAAKELGEKYGVEVVLNIQTPAEEDAPTQAAGIEKLAKECQGIAVNCSDAATGTLAIDKAVAAGVPVLCFGTDAPLSKRFFYYGVNDAACGQRVAAELIRVMGGKGNVAILAGNDQAPNLQARRKGMLAEFAKHPEIGVVGTVYHVEIPDAAAKAIAAEQAAHPEITGWALAGAWPLFKQKAFAWEPEAVKMVGVDALPQELDYVRDGHVNELLAQDFYGWGYKSVQVLLDKIVSHKDPASVLLADPMMPVTKDNADAFARQWDGWLGK